MIDHFGFYYDSVGVRLFSCRSTGCSCCSIGYDSPERDKEDILKELVGNLQVVDEVLKHYKISQRQFRKLYMEKNKNG